MNAFSKSNRIWWMIAVAFVALLVLTSSLGYVYYRSAFGPDPSFVLQHAAELDVQEVRINGQRASGASSATETRVHHNVPPAEEVSIKVVMHDGRIWTQTFPSMGRETRRIQLDDDNLQVSELGVVVLSFDATRPVTKVKFEPGRTSIVYESPVQRALPPGEHALEIEWNHDGLLSWLTRRITISKGQRLEISLDDLLKHTEINMESAVSQQR